MHQGKLVPRVKTPKRCVEVIGAPAEAALHVFEVLPRRGGPVLCPGAELLRPSEPSRDHLHSVRLTTRLGGGEPVLFFLHCAVLLKRGREPLSALTTRIPSGPERNGGREVQEAAPRHNHLHLASFMGIRKA